MRVKKTFEHVITTRTYDLGKDWRANIHYLLTETFKGRCYKGECYIIEILDIITIGDAVYNIGTNIDTVNISVRFSAEVEIYNRGEVIVGAVVSNCSNDNIVVCETPCARIVMERKGDVKTIAENQRVLVVVGATRYEQGSDRVSITGLLYSLPEEINVVYKITSKNTWDQIRVLYEQLHLLKEEKARYLSANSARIKHFKGRLGYYKDGEKALKSLNERLKKHKIESTTITKMAELFQQDAEPGPVLYYSRPFAMELESEDVYIFKSIAAANEVLGKVYVPVDEDINGFIDIIHNYREQLRVIRETAETYDADLEAKNRNVFAIYEKSKW